MATLDGVLETVLAVGGAVLALNVALAVLVWLYAMLFVGGSAVGLVVGLSFVVLGTVIFVGFVQLYLA